MLQDRLECSITLFLLKFGMKEVGYQRSRGSMKLCVGRVGIEEVGLLSFHTILILLSYLIQPIPGPSILTIRCIFRDRVISMSHYDE